MTTTPVERRLGERSTDVMLTSVAVGFFCAVFIRAAWIADESFRNFRVVANLLDGNGLRWNVVERVQTFTAPAWVLLLGGVTWISRNIPLTALALDGVFAGAAVLIVCVTATDISLGSVAALALALSPSFVNTSSAGLPDAFAFLLAAGTLAGCWYAPRHPIWIVSAAFLPLVSAPMALLVAPTVLWTVASAAPGSKLKVVLALAIPGIIWATFAVFYFGLPFPAPFYASWFQPHASRAAFGQDLADLVRSARADLVASVVIVAAIGRGLWTRSRREVPVALGLLIYLLIYGGGTILLGGDSVEGRALAPAVLVGVMMLAQVPWLSGSWRAMAVTGAVVVLGFLSAAPTFLPFRAFEPATRVDAHRQTYDKTGLLRANRYEPYPNLTSLEFEIQRRMIQKNSDPVSQDVGMFGYAAGARLAIVDSSGRFDLNALPNRDAVQALARESLWSTGHLRSVLRINVTTLGGLFPARGVGSQESE